jgi:predicted dehydrogenase/threonine dehydrogenase-like Zn-dependent dehydrogenase
MHQVIRKGIREIIVDEVPDPVAAPHHVLIRPAVSLISSGTETASIHQQGLLKEVADNPSHIRKVLDAMEASGPIRTLSEVRAKLREYAILGYAGAGVVVDKHSTVTDIEIGQRVAYGGEGTGHAETITTGRHLVARMPDDLPFEHAAFATLGSIALNAVRIAQLSLGDTVAVIGLGLVGQLVAQLARLQGGTVIATDLRPERVDLARRLGAHHALVGGDDMQKAVAAVTDGRGADCVIVAAAAKSSGPCHQALQISRDRGRLVILGAVDMSFPWHEMYLKEMQLFMSRAYGPGSYDVEYEKHGRDYPVSYIRWTENRNMEEFLRLAATGELQLQPLITHQWPLEEAPAAYQTIMDPASSSLAVLLKYPGPQTASSFRPTRRVDTPRSVLPRRASNSIGVALVGAGGLARWAHLPNLRKISGVRLRGVHSASGARGRSYALTYGAEYCCTDYDEILRDPEVDAVLITSRNQHHAAQAEAALRAGKHVFVEKPMALTEDECWRLSRAVRETGLALTVGFNRRFAPFYRELKRAIERRTENAVVNCRVNSPSISGPYWMADPAIGGAILGEACHFVDLMHWLLDSEPLVVSAYSLPADRKEPIGTNNLVASFRFANGSIGSLTYTTVGSRTSAGERVEVFAQGAGAWTENFKTVVVQKGVRRKRRKIWGDKGYAAQLSGFFDDIRQGRTPPVTVLDGARATVGCLRMLDSARESKPCAIDLGAFVE